jgi:prevent-host-death family protein
MIKVNARQARTKLSDLLTEAQRGQTVAITRRGRVVAQLVPPPAPGSAGPFPDLTEFRESIKVKPATPSASELIRKMRDGERS